MCLFIGSDRFPWWKKSSDFFWFAGQTDSASIFHIWCQLPDVAELLSDSIILFTPILSGTLLGKSHPLFIEENTEAEKPGDLVSVTPLEGILPPLFHSKPSNISSLPFHSALRPSKVLNHKTRQSPRPTVTDSRAVCFLGLGAAALCIPG